MKQAILVSVAILAGAALVGLLVSHSLNQIPKGSSQPVEVSLGAAGESASSSRTAVISAQYATGTICTLYNFGSRDRIVTGGMLYLEVASNTSILNFLAGTSTASSSNPATAVFTQAIPTVAGSTTIVKVVTTSVDQLTGQPWRALWKSGEWFNFKASSGLQANTGEDGLCQVDYVIAPSNR